jgi:uroporphyrinogen decarboxylase
MIEGGASEDYRNIKTLMLSRPELLHHILDINACAVTAFLNAQIEAGAQAVMVFDSWGGTLSTHAYREFSLRYLAQIVAGLKKEHDGARIPNIVFTKGGGQWLEMIAATGCDAVGLDWTTDLGNARSRIGDKVALQGNFDPSALFAPPEAIRAEVGRLLASFGHGPGHVFNLGHGISQYTPPEHVAALIDAVHSLSRQYHAQPAAA